ncbi:MAG: hypothetical protein EHM58_07860 [Ignavibacteriae bacterium]|nr:MAG: hypothetical protein EHM58_07860 [Ignavibacteriota bacterium]
MAQVDSIGNLITSGTVFESNPFNITHSFNNSADKQSNWSPDGRVLVFSSVQGDNQEIYAYFFNSDGSLDTSITEIPKRLFSSDGSWDNNPYFSPDGKYLIWDKRYDNSSPIGIVDTADSRDLYIGDISGSGNTLQVANRRAIITTIGADEYNPKWSPRISVRRIAYEYQGSATSTDHDVYVIDPFDTTINTTFYNPNNSGYPAWSPACDKIIFESDKSNGDFWKIVSLAYPTNSGQPADIAAEQDVHLRYPTWLPNGGLVAFIRFDPASNKGNIWITSISGGTPIKLLQSQPQFDNSDNLWPA